MTLHQTDPAQDAALPPRGSLWQTLTGTDAGAAAQAWADLMFERIGAPGEADPVSVVMFRLDPATRRLLPAGQAPQARAPTPDAISAAEAALEAGRGVVRGDGAAGLAPTAPRPSAARQTVTLALPIAVDGVSGGVAVAEILPLQAGAARPAMRRLQWGAAWMRDRLRSERSAEDAARYEAAAQALHAVVAVAETGDFATGARAAVTDLSTRFGCERVSLGFRRRKHSRLAAISHSAQFSRNMGLVRDLAETMDEAIDQRSAVLFPPPADDPAYVTRAAEVLARDDGVSHVFTVPLYVRDAFIGAMVFERPADAPFTQRDLDILEAVVTVLAPVLDEKRRNDRWLVTKTAVTLRNQLVKLFGPAYLGRKLLLLGLAALCVFFWFARAPYTVSADAIVQGAVQRSISAGFDGFIAAAPVRPGDTVREGALLVQLDDRDLVLDRLRLVTERQRREIEYDRALADRDRAEARILATQIEQADAQLRLVDEQIARTRLTAPFDGLVLEGDLSQAIGASVARGEPLMTVAPLDDFRIQLAVPEGQIADIMPGQTGQLRLTAYPDRAFTVEVEAITPVAEYGDGQTRFRVDATLVGAGALRPGLEGVARIEVEDRRLIRIWTDPIIDWFRLKLWQYRPV
ncbi:efflux RND transporter periplasmic adaptor subunit [Oceanomicrobium pacificus]|uniref:HlyD family efflux transporter periplasmic adaptor subunit n=1 Tax=Oceanomicrobium pacificus TaxID=2692916 RepID=A0A6B0TPV6_9RHOB|nr:efflux RND transporter periplasmic adaptor subunit [Oceanomicrobium pacificus]MXU66700.1 HlyD family efflux transporter periplasmic adaptor subunit [Oceanomicrobium pacificus]